MWCEVCDTGRMSNPTTRQQSTPTPAHAPECDRCSDAAHAEYRSLSGRVAYLCAWHAGPIESNLSRDIAPRWSRTHTYTSNGGK